MSNFTADIVVNIKKELDVSALGQFHIINKEYYDLAVKKAVIQVF